MNIRVNNMLPVVVALILAVLTLWLRQTAELPPGSAPAANENQPDAIVNNLSIVRLGGNGKPQYSMKASRMLHYTRDNVSVLEGPRFDKQDADGVKTAITAARGKVMMNSDEAFFYGDVRMERNTPGARGNLRARTEFLHVIPARDLILSDRHVTITNGSSTLSGVGLEINKASGRISLQSQVKGSYHAAR